MNNERLYLNGALTTQEDPRLGALHSGWQLFYHGGGAEMDGDGNFNSWWFQNLSTGEAFWDDPRLAKQYLIEMGVAMEDFVII
jgi:hypothetical protein